MEILFGGLFGGFILLWLFMLGAGIASFIFWLIMMIAAVKNDYEHKGVWILILFLFNIVGAFIFYFVPYQQIKAAKKTTQPASSQ